MRIRRFLVGPAVLLLVGLTALPAQATTVTIADFAFSPSSLKVAQGATLNWYNSDCCTHTSTENSPLSLWDTGYIPSGSTSSSVALLAAGSYPYHCAIHTLMTAVVKVPIKASPSTGSVSTTFTITLASATQSGFTYDIQKKVGTGSFAVWKTGVTSRTKTFTGSVGTYSFRSRLHRTTSGATSGWSPAKKITIS
jgi:plastocyanin